MSVSKGVYVFLPESKFFKVSSVCNTLCFPVPDGSKIHYAKIISLSEFRRPQLKDATLVVPTWITREQKHDICDHRVIACDSGVCIYHTYTDSSCPKNIRDSRLTMIVADRWFETCFHLFPEIWGFYNHRNWRTKIFFQRRGEKPPTSHDSCWLLGEISSPFR